MWTGKSRRPGLESRSSWTVKRPCGQESPSEQVVRTLRVALDGAEAGLIHDPTTRDPVPIVLRLDRAQRAHVEDLLQLTVHGGDGRMVPLSEITTVVAPPT